MVLNKFKKKFNHLLSKISTPFIKLGIDPTVITLAGMLSAIASSIIFISSRGYEQLLLGTFFFVLSSIFDGLDGIVARSLGKVSLRGAFIDSFSDRVNEVVVLTGLMIGEVIDPLSGLLFLLTSLLISYVRARGEGLGVELSGVGIMERAERLTLIFIILLLCFLSRKLADYVLAVGVLLNVITITQRVNHTLSNLT